MHRRDCTSTPTARDTYVNSTKQQIEEVEREGDEREAHDVTKEDVETGLIADKRGTVQGGAS